MRHWKSFACVVLLASCGQMGIQVKPTPKLASIAEAKGSELTPEALREHVQSKLSELHLLQLGAYVDLRDFDLSLQRDWQGLAASTTYSKLQAARVMVEELEEDLHQIQQELLLLAEDESQTVEARLGALATLDRTLPRPEQVQGAWAYTLWRVHHRNQVLARHLLLAQGRTQEVAVQVACDKLYQSFKQLYGAFTESEHDFSNWKEVVQKEHARLRPLADFQRVSKTVEHSAHELRFEREKMARDQKSGEAGNFRPSTTARGSLSGEELPAKVWALTFNDGPIPGTSNKIVDQLMQRKFSATFFQLTKLARKYPRTAKYVRTAGMDIGAHGDDHLNLAKASTEDRDHQIRQATLDLSAVHENKTIQFYRLPYGAGVSNRELRARLLSAQLLHVSWSVDALDWQAQPASDIAQRVIRQMGKASTDSGIVVFHESMGQTATAARDVMQFMKQRDYRSCGLTEIVDQLNRKGTVCPSSPELSSN